MKNAKIWPRDECQSARVRDHHELKFELNFAAFLLEFERRLGPFSLGCIA